MSTLPLTRTQYWNLSTNTVRGGASAHGESLTDMESYILPQAQTIGAGFHTWGVAEGLSVSASANQPDVNVAPGTALDAAGHLIALAANGFAITDPAVDPSQMQNVPTVPIGPTGVALATAPLTGDQYLTITWREVQGQGQLANAPVMLHTPWLRLEPVAGFQDTGEQVILARVTLDNNSAVTALTTNGRRLAGLPAEHIELRHTRAAVAGLQIDQVAGAELRARADGGVEVNLLPGGAQALALDGSGNLGLGTDLPQASLHLVSAGSPTTLRIQSAAGLGAARVEFWSDLPGSVDEWRPGFIQSLDQGNTTGALAFFTNGSGANNKTGQVETMRLANGRVGIGTTSPAAGLEINRGNSNDLAFKLTASGPGWGSGLQFSNQAPNARTYGMYAGSDAKWHFTDQNAAADRLVMDQDGRVGIGTVSPGAGIEISKGNTNDLALKLTSSGPGWGSGLQLSNTAPGARDYGIFAGSDGKWHVTDEIAHSDRLVIDQNGSVGIGTATPQRPLHVEGSEIHSGGGGAGFSFGNRGTAGFVDMPPGGERWVWYALDGSARLWSGGDKLWVTPGGELNVGRRMTVFQGPDPSAGIWFYQNGANAQRGFVGMSDDNHIGFWGNNGAGWGLTMDTTNRNLWFGGDYGRPDGPSTLSLWASRIGDVGGGTLFLRSGGNVVAFDGNDSVGIGTAAPAWRLHVHSDNWGSSSEIHASGATVGLSYTDRQAGRTWDNGGAGERWVWYSEGRVTRLWNPAKITLDIDANGNMNLFGGMGLGVGNGRTWQQIPGWSGGGVICWDLFYGNQYKWSTVREKEDIRPLADVLSRFDQLNPVHFSRRDGPSGQPQMGLIAEELREIFPECTVDKTAEPGDFFAWGINQDSLHALTVAAIQELARKVKQMEARLSEVDAGPDRVPTLAPAAGARKISVLRETGEPSAGEECYLTARFTGRHPSLGDVATVRTCRVHPDQPSEAMLQAAYDRWFQSLDPETSA